MPLKPGQKKELKVQAEKLKGLETLQKKLEKLNDTRYHFDMASNIGSDALNFAKQEFDKLYQKIKVEIENTKKEIEKLQKNAKPNTKLDALVKTIAKECSQAIAEYRKTKLVLLRGMNDAPGVFVGRSWNNRSPKDSSDEAQKIYDAVLSAKGFKALRSNSIFTTTDLGQASQYGETYYIFPKNGFAFHWNKHEPDLVLDDITNLLSMSKIEDITVDVENWYYKTNKKELNWIYEDPYEAAYSIRNFIKKLNQLKYPKAKQITVEKLVDMEFINLDVGPTNTNFAAGLKSGNEMVISGEYYAVDAYTEIGKYILNALNLKSNVDF